MTYKYKVVGKVKNIREVLLLLCNLFFYPSPSLTIVSTSTPLSISLHPYPSSTVPRSINVSISQYMSHGHTYFLEFSIFLQGAENVNKWGMLCCKNLSNSISCRIYIQHYFFLRSDQNYFYEIRVSQSESIGYTMCNSYINPFIKQCHIGV